MLLFPFQNRQNRLLLFQSLSKRTTLQHYNNVIDTPQHYHPMTSFLSPSSSATKVHMTAVAPLPLSRAVALAPRPSMSLIQFLLAFTAGGLFFSTAVAAVGACYAIGMDNVTRLRSIIRIVITRVWETLLVGLGATKVALRPDGTSGSWKWRDAWETLKQKLQETRRAAVEGVEAIRLEANMYAAAVGAPGLIPLQYVIDRLMPLSLGAALEDSFKEALADVKNKNIKKLTLAEFSAGNKSPQLAAARVYDLGTEAMAFDCDVKWDSELQATINVYSVGGLARLPVSVRNISFEGVVRVVLAPLVKTQPGFGAALVSFPKVPKIGLDIRVAGGEVTKVPWLRSELMSVIQKSITDELLWPRRIVVPSMTLGSSKPKPILSQRELDDLLTSDPLLQVEKALAEKPVLRETLQSDKPDGNSVRKLLNVLVKDENGLDSTNGNGDDILNDKLKTKYDNAVKSKETISPGGALPPSHKKHHPSSTVQSGLVWKAIQSYLKTNLKN